ncbi:cobalt-precorrin-6A synthase, partial [Paenibacillus riograndensis]
WVGLSLGHGKGFGSGKRRLVGRAGKRAKVGEGARLIQSKKAPVDFRFLAKSAAESGEDNELVGEIAAANTASQVTDLMTAAGNGVFFEQLCLHACRHCLKHMNGGMTVEMVLVTMKGRVLGRAEIRGGHYLYYRHR